MTNYDAGDVVLVQFPFTDMLTHKKRPAVVVSSNNYQRNKQDVIIMAITSQIKFPARFGELIVQDWQQAGLAKPSVIKPVIATIEKKVILHKLGHLSDFDSGALKRAIKTLFM